MKIRLEYFRKLFLIKLGLFLTVFLFEIDSALSKMAKKAILSVSGKRERLEMDSKKRPGYAGLSILNCCWAGNGYLSGNVAMLSGSIFNFFKKILSYFKYLDGWNG